MGFLVWLIVINIAVFVHEFAHYFAAKRQGVAVHAFSIGMGPVFYKRTWNGTEWRLSWFPVGGYVDIAGMAPTEVEGKLVAAKDGFANLGYWGKFLILFAGPLANVLLAIALIAALLAGQGKPLPGNVICLRAVQPGSMAESAGFKTGDIILKINGKQLLPDNLTKQAPEDPKLIKALENGIQTIRDNLRTNGERVYTINRAQKNLDIKFNWSPKGFGNAPRPLFGVSIGTNETYAPLPIATAALQATTSLLGSIPTTIKAIISGLFHIATFQKDDNIAGPAGTIQVASSAASQGIWQIIMFAGLINFSLGIFNLLPIPGLDGGRIFLNTIIALRRKPFKPGQEEMINFAGFVFVILLIVLVTIQDFSKLGK